MRSALRTISSLMSASRAPIPSCRPRSRSALRRRRAIAASALAAADLWRIRSGRGKRSASTCATPRPNSAASATCASTERPRRAHGTRSPGIYRCGDGGLGAPSHQFSPSSRRHPRPPRLRRMSAMPWPSAQRDGMPSHSRRRPPKPEWWSRPCVHSTNGMRIRKARRCRAFRSSRSRRSARPKARASAARRAPALGRARSRSHPRHRRPGVRAHLGGSWRGRASRHRAPSPLHRSFGDRHRTRQTLDEPRSARRGAKANAAGAAFEAPTSSSRAIAPARSRRAASDRKTRRRFARASFTSRFAPMARKAPGPGGAASIRSCRRPAGFNDAEARSAGSELPKPLPAQALDHATGYLMAFGAMTALARRAREGGSWHVQLSLARTAQWLRSLGRVENGFACPDPSEDDVPESMEESPSGVRALASRPPRRPRCRKHPLDGRGLPCPSEPIRPFGPIDAGYLPADLMRSKRWAYRGR